MFCIHVIHCANVHYRVDVLWGQPIKLTQVASTSELLENQRNDLVVFKIIASHFCRASEASKIDCFKNQVWKVWTKLFMAYFMFALLRSHRNDREQFQKKKVVSLIFTQFWSRSHLSKLDRLTPQDVYYRVYYAVVCESWCCSMENESLLTH